MSNSSVHACTIEVQDHCALSRVRKLSRIITSLYDRAFRPHGITGAQLVLLCEIQRRNMTRSVDIGVGLDMEKSTLSRNLRRLAKLGLINQGELRGRQGRWLNVTEQGKEKIEACMPAWRSAQVAANELVRENYGDKLEKFLPCAVAA